jgi:hypothetical protein
MRAVGHFLEHKTKGGRNHKTNENERHKEIDRQKRVKKRKKRRVKLRNGTSKKKQKEQLTKFLIKRLIAKKVPMSNQLKYLL